MAKQWGAKDPSRLLLLRSIEQAQIGIERMMYIERKKIEGLMQSTIIATAFFERAGLSDKIAHALPDWFFLEEGKSEKQRAVKVSLLYDEAADFKARFTDQLAARVKDAYPTLFEYVMRGQKEGASFLIALGQRYKASAVTLNLAALLNELKECWEFHFVWAEAPLRAIKRSSMGCGLSKWRVPSTLISHNATLPICKTVCSRDFLHWRRWINTRRS